MARTRTAAQRLARLGNSHKWFVGGGRRVIWAPDFPVHLDRPGFWDAGTYLEVKLPAIFTFTLLEGGRVLPWRQQRRHWWPDRLQCRYGAEGLSIEETRTVSAEDAFTSEVELRSRSGRTRTVDVVLWGRVDATDIATPQFTRARLLEGGVDGLYETFDRQQRREHALRMTWTLTHGARRGCTSRAVLVSERGGKLPDWRETPFYELFDGKLPEVCEWWGGIEHRPGQRPFEKEVFVGVHQRVTLRPRGGARLVGRCRVEPAKGGRVAAPVVGGWSKFFDQAPSFECSDPYLTKYYDYRWYGLRLNAVDAGAAPLRHPCVFEGINAGWFRHAISYSAQVLPRDCRWLHDPRLAQGMILNFLEHQRADGFIHGGLLTGEHSQHEHTGHLYHCDWGAAVRAVHEVHPDSAFLQACYEPLTRYAAYFDKARDSERSGMYDVCAQAETGQEYMSRYLFVDPQADEWGPFRMKGVDATVYIYELQAQLAWMAEVLGDARAARRWHERAARTAAAVRGKMWDSRRRKFCDVHPRTRRRSPVRALTDFYPFMTDIAGKEHLPALREHLFDQQAFWTKYPAPSTALDDKLADAYGRWKGKRKNCPWNGRTWLMTNSHIAEALARATLTLDRRLERHATHFMRQFVHMLFVDHDLDRPTSYEYYNPLTGQAPFFRGTDEYMHSWIVDLIIKYVAGLRPRADGTVVVEPLDFGLSRFALTNCRVAGQAVEVVWNGATLTAKVGQREQRRRGLGRMEF